MKKKVMLIDYLGNSYNNIPIGHPIKIINEYVGLLKDEVELTLSVPKNYVEYINCKNDISIKVLPYNIEVSHKSKNNKIKNTLNKLRNIKIALKENKCDVVWFVNIDFILGLSVIINKWLYKRDKEVWITTYLDKFSMGNNLLKNCIKNFMFDAIVKRCNCIISSNKNFQFNNDNILYVSDYSYDEKTYGKYLNIKKKRQVACVGTMSNAKDLNGLVSLFNKLDIKLKIVGKFYDENLYRNLLNGVNENIIIENKILSDDEYYKLIAESEFLIVPYKKEFYNNRTSGVLQEAMFLNTIPIAPDFLLKYNSIDGVGYGKIGDLETFFENDKCKKSEKIYTDFQDISNPYNKQNIKNKICNMIDKDK